MLCHVTGQFVLQIWLGAQALRQSVQIARIENLSPLAMLLLRLLHVLRHAPHLAPAPHLTGARLPSMDPLRSPLLHPCRTGWRQPSGFDTVLCACTVGTKHAEFLRVARSWLTE